MVAAPFFPDLPARLLDRAERLVPSVDARTIFLPWLSILADRNNSLGMTLGDCGMTLPRVVRAARADDCDPLIRRDLRQQIWQYRRVTNFVGCNLDRPDLHGLGVYPQVHFSPLPTARGAMLAGFPFPFARHLDTSAIDQQMETA